MPAKTLSTFDQLKADEDAEVTVTPGVLGRVHITVRKDGATYVAEGASRDEAAEKVLRLL